MAVHSIATPQAYFLKEAAVSDQAVCLDGSPGAYYFLAGNESTKWYIHHQGGGETMLRGWVASNATIFELQFRHVFHCHRVAAAAATHRS
jgi:hypothetical protein